MKASTRTLRLLIDLPVTGTQRSKKKPHIDFDFEGVAEGIEKATGLPVVINYGYPGKHRVPKVTQVGD